MCTSIKSTSNEFSRQALSRILVAFSRRVDHERLIRVCLNDYDRELALVAVHNGPDGGRAIAGVASLSREWRSSSAEFAVTVGDSWQGRGLGRQLLQLLIEIGRKEGVEQVTGRILPDHWMMLNLCQSLGFGLRHNLDEVIATLNIHGRRTPD
ncbi:MAG: GNAT family N-acetyltransferase [Planctomycetes bacterium]|nr:GNAT family N-acetyltransferase [Planctomycetota bacterium]